MTGPEKVFELGFFRVNHCKFMAEKGNVFCPYYKERADG